MRTLVPALVVALIGTLLPRSGAAAAEIGLASLLAEMVDLKGLAEFPEPPYTCKQFSSYDRASKSPQEDWFANGDFGKYLRVEERDGRKENVMMDAAGPGAIVRIWSANPEGTLRIYLDEAESPVIEAPMKDLLGGNVPGFPRPIAHEVSRGWNSYLPIPYARHCKVTVTAEHADRIYYHINYRTYPAGTQVATLKKADLETHAGAIRDVAERLASPRKGGVQAEGREQHQFKGTMAPGGTFSHDLHGEHAICSFKVRLTAKDPVQALRKIVLTMQFDRQQTVESPLGDFFGTAPGPNPYASLMCGIEKDGEMWSHWHMPFRRNAVITFHNHGSDEAGVECVMSVVPHTWTERSLYFHAKWRIEFDVPARPMRDWNYLTVQGKGVFAGVAFNIANPVKNWWGEGDEKIYFDGQTFPSHFGTGTEDYYGYAWCCNEIFTHAYHNQPRCDGPGNYGHTGVNRWHVIDRIPFTKDFRFDMELWHSNEHCKVTMAVIAYWYAMAGATDAFKPIRPSDLKLDILPPWTAHKVQGALEGEEMRVVAKTATVGPQDIDGCSDGRHIWWRDGQRPGDKLVLAFRWKRAAGNYRVTARFVKAVDYGIVQLSINGTKAAATIDLYNDGVIVSPEMDLGTFPIKQGDNQLEVEVVGANEKALKEYMFGLDYILLKSAD